ncbi:MAG: galactose mutarotase, partial [Rikenellaceae bacterium]|nr:galactose mutarotase [Rikenellaceae bacterium]
MTIEQNIWGFTEDGEAVVLYTLRNASGAEVRLTNIGAAIVGVTVPDKAGNMKDVCLGYPDWKSWFHDGPAMGKTPGRYANRIALGRFTLDGVQYQLACNNGPNALHGGPNGFHNRLWTGRVETDRVVFSYLSADGEEGYPGELGAEVVYDWDDDYNLEITYFARSNAATVVNLTNHAYFNMAGEDAGSVQDNTLKIYATHWLPTDDTQIPTGEIAPVAGTPMDFTRAKPIGRDIEADFGALKIGHGYDHCWMVDNYKERGELDSRLRDVALLADPASGRSLLVRSTQPAAQV